MPTTAPTKSDPTFAPVETAIAQQKLIRRILELSHGLMHGEIVIRYVDGKPQRLVRTESELFA